MFLLEERLKQRPLWRFFSDQRVVFRLDMMTSLARSSPISKFKSKVHPHPRRMDKDNANLAQKDEGGNSFSAWMRIVWELVRGKRGIGMIIWKREVLPLAFRGPILPLMIRKGQKGDFEFYHKDRGCKGLIIKIPW